MNIAMLAIFVILVGIGMTMQVFNLEHKSYFIAFCISAVAAVLFLLFRDRLDCSTLSINKLDSRKIVLPLTILCLLVNGLWIFIFRIEPANDFGVFWSYANTLANGHFAPSNYIALFPHLFGYSLFLSWFIQLFGASQMLVPVINVLLTTGSGIVIYYLVEAHYGKLNAVFAFLLWIVMPGKLVFNAFVLSEPLYTNIILISILLVDRVNTNALKVKHKILTGIIAGAVLGFMLRAANCVRPVGVIVVIAFFIWLILLRGEDFKNRNRWKVLVPLSIAMLAVYIPLGSAWENYMFDRLGEKPATVPGYNIYVGFNPDTNGTYCMYDIDQLFAYYYDEYGSADAAQHAQEHMFQDSIRRITKDGIDYSVLIPYKLKEFHGDDEAAAFYSLYELTDRQYSVICVLCNIVYYFTVIIALLNTVSNIGRHDTSALQLVPLFIIGLTLAHLIVEVAGRYHYSMVPMLVIMAAQFKPKDKERSV